METIQHTFGGEELTSYILFEGKMEVTVGKKEVYVTMFPKERRRSDLKFQRSYFSAEHPLGVLVEILKEGLIY